MKMRQAEDYNTHKTGNKTQNKVGLDVTWRWIQTK